MMMMLVSVDGSLGSGDVENQLAILLFDAVVVAIIPLDGVYVFGTLDLVVEVLQGDRSVHLHKPILLGLGLSHPLPLLFIDALEALDLPRSDVLDLLGVTEELVLNPLPEFIVVGLFDVKFELDREAEFL